MPNRERPRPDRRPRNTVPPVAAVDAVSPIPTSRTDAVVVGSTERHDAGSDLSIRRCWPWNAVTSVLAIFPRNTISATASAVSGAVGGHRSVDLCASRRPSRCGRVGSKEPCHGSTHLIIRRRRTRGTVPALLASVAFRAGHRGAGRRIVVLRELLGGRRDRLLAAVPGGGLLLIERFEDERELTFQVTDAAVAFPLPLLLHKRGEHEEHNRDGGDGAPHGGRTPRRHHPQSRGLRSGDQLSRMCCT